MGESARCNQSSRKLQGVECSKILPINDGGSFIQNLSSDGMLDEAPSFGRQGTQGAFCGSNRSISGVLPAPNGGSDFKVCERRDRFVVIFHALEELDHGFRSLFGYKELNQGA